MSVALSSSLCFEIGDFGLWDKARNAFLTQGFLPSDVTKVGINSEEPSATCYFLYQKTRKDNADAPRYSFLRCKIIHQRAQNDNDDENEGLIALTHSIAPTKIMPPATSKNGRLDKTARQA